MMLVIRSDGMDVESMKSSQFELDFRNGLCCSRGSEHCGLAAESITKVVGWLIHPAMTFVCLKSTTEAEGK